MTLIVCLLMICIEWHLARAQIMKAVSSGAPTTDPVEDSLARMTTVSSKDSFAKMTPFLEEGVFSFLRIWLESIVQVLWQKLIQLSKNLIEGYYVMIQSNDDGCTDDNDESCYLALKDESWSFEFFTINSEFSYYSNIFFCGSLRSHYLLMVLMRYQYGWKIFQWNIHHKFW